MEPFASNTSYGVVCWASGCISERREKLVAQVLVRGGAAVAS